MTFEPTHLADLAKAPRDGAALVDEGRTITWDALDSATHRVGRALLNGGAEPGDHAVLMATNRVEFVIAMLAMLRAGLVMTPIKTNWTPREVGQVIEDASSTLIVTDKPAGREAAAAAGIRSIDLVDDLAKFVDDDDLAPLPPGAPGYRMTFTSGTTGRPKGVKRSTDGAPFEDWWAGSAIGSQAVGLPAHGTHLMVSQLFHGAPLGFGLGALAGGATMRIADRWDAQTALDHFSSGANAAIMVPTMFRQLLALPDSVRNDFDPSGIEAIFHGGEACPPSVKHAMIEWWGPVFTEYYGFTEGGMTMASSEQWLARPGTVGRPFGTMEVQVLDDNGASVAPGTDGTVYFRRGEAARFFDYVGEEEKTANAHRPDGAFTVGDIGHLDSDGYLYLSGRTAELIVRAGVNIYPAEIEAVLFDVPGVADAGVAGVPCDEFGEAVAAWVVPVDGAHPDDVCAAVEAKCASDLAGYKRPRDLHVVDPGQGLPRDPTGKLQRRLLPNLQPPNEPKFSS